MPLIVVVRWGGFPDEGLEIINDPACVAHVILFNEYSIGSQPRYPDGGNLSPGSGGQDCGSSRHDVFSFRMKMKSELLLLLRFRRYPGLMVFREYQRPAHRTPAGPSRIHMIHPKSGGQRTAYRYPADSRRGSAHALQDFC